MHGELHLNVVGKAHLTTTGGTRPPHESWMSRTFAVRVNRRVTPRLSARTRELGNR
jgi:hypothetical protein